MIKLKTETAGLVIMLREFITTSIYRLFNMFRHIFFIWGCGSLWIVSYKLFRITFQTNRGEYWITDLIQDIHWSILLSENIHVWIVWNHMTQQIVVILQSYFPKVIFSSGQLNLVSYLLCVKLWHRGTTLLIPNNPSYLWSTHICPTVLCENLRYPIRYHPAWFQDNLIVFSLYK